MPNWCENELDIEGPEEFIKELKTHLKTGKEDKLDFNEFVPYPKSFIELDKKAKAQDKKRGKAIADGLSHEEATKKYPYVKDGFNQGGHKWCCKNWGTKWNACDVSISFEDKEGMHIEMDTAWSPPIPVIEAMAKKFPGLIFTLRFFECGAGFNGYHRWEKGKIVEAKEGDYFGNRGG